MEEKKDNVINYISKTILNLREYGISVTKEQVTELIENYIDFNQEESEIYRVIDEKTDEVIENYKRMLEEKEKFMKALQEARELRELPLDYQGITLNKQDIDLMKIATDPGLSEKEREDKFNDYMEDLVSRTDYYNDPSIELAKKIEKLLKDAVVTQEELNTIIRIKKESSNNEELKTKLEETFDKEKLHNIFKAISDYSTIEKTGIKDTSMEAFENLYEEVLNNYNSITIDEEAKYGHIVLQDGTFNFDRLRETLDFAKATNNQVRLNTILFYMDCPEELYNLPVNEESKQIVKEKLSSYVEAITAFIKENGYESVVRSVDVFNELLNRHPLDGEPPYEYRGNIPQDSNNDNTKAGWLKHLDIEDLCDVIAIARQNLPNTDFMYNEDNLTDPKKMPATIDLITRIQAYEQEHNIRLIDSIGEQMHVSNAVTKQEIVNMLITLSSFGLPIEITEFDMCMTENGVDKLSDEEIEVVRQQKMNEIYTTLEAAKDLCDIRGLTIWSKTDKQNFIVSLKNEERIKQGLDPITSVHGGMFTENMELKSKVNERLISPENQVDKMVEKMATGQYDEYGQQVKEEVNQKVKVNTMSVNGYIKICILEILTVLIGVGIIILGIFLNK